MSSDPQEWGLQLSFHIDTDGYSKRDRDMFVAGYEFATIASEIQDNPDRFLKLIHRENESRIRMLAGKFKRRIDITPHEGYEGCETWSDLRVGESP